MKGKINILEAFKKEDKKVFCKLCNYEIMTDYGKISIRTTDSTHRYTKSKRPFINTYILLCCQPCFKKMMKGVEETIHSLYDSNKKSKT